MARAEPRGRGGALRGELSGEGGSPGGALREGFSGGRPAGALQGGLSGGGCPGEALRRAFSGEASHAPSPKVTFLSENAKLRNRVFLLSGVPLLMSDIRDPTNLFARKCKTSRPGIFAVWGPTFDV